MTANPEGLALGIDIGGTKMLGVIMNGECSVVAEQKVQTPQRTIRDGGESVLSEVTTMVRDLHLELGLTLGDIPLGVGVPGMVSLEGVLIYGPHLQSSSGVSFQKELTKLLDSKVSVGNDADFAALAEYQYGAGQGYHHMVMVTLGTGIGAGIIANGELLRGGNGFAGEVGHMVLDIDGPPCPCGANGCWERYASGTGIARLVEESLATGHLDSVIAYNGGERASVNGEVLTRAARAGNQEALVVLAEVGWWVARGIANLSAVLDPTCVVLGGGLSNEIPLLLPFIKRSLETMLEGGDRHPGIDVVPASLGERAGACGAALWARQER